MSIEQTNVVDFVSIDPKTERVVLTISDHLPWDERGTHLKLLQDKLNSYLAFIESGELQERYPKAVGRKATIRIHGKFPLDQQAKQFVDMATPVIREAGFDLQFVLFEPREE